MAVYQWREWQAAGGGAAAIPRTFVRTAPASAPGSRARLDLIVDLGENLLSRDWWRGAATLALLVGTAAIVAPWPAPLTDDSSTISREQESALADIGVAPARFGAQSGGRMAAAPNVEPLLSAPERAQVDLLLRLGSGDRLGALLARVGARSSDAVAVDRLVAANGPGGIAPGTPISVRLGRKGAGGQRPIERVALRAGLSTDLALSATADGFAVQAATIAVDATPRRIRGRVGDGLYWALRSAGVEPATASDYLKALATQVDVGSDLSPDDRFDLIVANRRAASGENEVGPLLYAGIQRIGAQPIQLLKWTVGGHTDWYDASSLTQVSGSSLLWPVAAPVTSEFGMRYHPILHFARMHRGMDFGARWGTPIVASADGQVERAGWAGGYGQQVRIAHAGGIETSYSHMSRMVVEPGSIVRQGQLIGYVGTTGLSTGPHLHYETYRGGVAVNPRTVRFATQAVGDPGALQKFKARMQALLGSAKG